MSEGTGIISSDDLPPPGPGVGELGRPCLIRTQEIAGSNPAARTILKELDFAALLAALDAPEEPTQALIDLMRLEGTGLDIETDPGFHLGGSRVIHPSHTTATLYW